MILPWSVSQIQNTQQYKVRASVFGGLLNRKRKLMKWKLSTIIKLVIGLLEGYRQYPAPLKSASNLLGKHVGTVYLFVFSIRVA